MQEALVIVTIAAAAGYIAWKAWRSLFAKTKCDGCSFSKGAQAVNKQKL